MIPPTSNILDAVKEFIIKMVDPSQLGVDVYDGLKQKEYMLSCLTHDAISESIGEDKYLELEAQVNSTIKKEGIVAVLSSESGLPSNQAPSMPTLSFYITEQDSSSSSSSIGEVSTINTDTYYPYYLIASGGNLSLMNFQPDIQIMNKPLNSTVDIILDDQMSTESHLENTGHIRFDTPGIYTIHVKIVHEQQEDLIITTTMNVVVV